MNIEYLPLSEIHPYERNPRRSGAAVDAVCRSIREFGFRQPIILDADHVIISGHTRLLAAEKAGENNTMKNKPNDNTPTGDQLVIVYGTLMAGECNERRACNPKSREPVIIRGTLYDPRYGFPAFVPDPKGGEVRAELLTVPAETLLGSLDRLEGYPLLYNRVRIPATHADGTVAEGWVYVLNRLPKGAVPIEGGDWPAYRRAQAAWGAAR